MSSSRGVCIYLNVNDMAISINFHKELLQLDVEDQYEDRWAQFKIFKRNSTGVIELQL